MIRGALAIVFEPHGTRLQALIVFGRQIRRQASGVVGEIGSSDPPAADDHGNDRASATPLTAGVVFDGHIEESGDTDWFRFDVARAGEYTVETRGTTDTKCAFMDPQDAFIGDENDDGEGDELQDDSVSGSRHSVGSDPSVYEHDRPYEVIVQAPVTADDHGGDRVMRRWWSPTRSSGVISVRQAMRTGSPSMRR